MMKKDIAVVLIFALGFTVFGACYYYLLHDSNKEEAVSLLSSSSSVIPQDDSLEPSNEEVIKAIITAEDDGIQISMEEAVKKNVNTIFGELELLFSQRDSLEAFTLEEERKLNQLKNELMIYASNTPSIVDDIISIYRSNPNSDLGNYLYDVLTQFDGDKVTELALELTHSSQREDMMAGLSLLSETHVSSVEAYSAAESILLSHQHDDELMLLAMSAIPRQLPTDIETTQVVNVLQQLTTHQDGAIRSESIFSIGRLAKNAESLSVVIKASKSEDLDDRVSVAMVLQESSLVSDELLNHLVERMSDHDEEWEVRRLSADSLKRFDLNPSQQEAYQLFKDEEERVAHL